jgi:hypothetical protein
MCSCRCSRHGAVHDYLDGNFIESPSAARFVVSRPRLPHFTRFHVLIMMALTFRQLDRTRQPGFAQRGASWSAPLQAGASSSGDVIGVTFEQYKSVGGRDSRPTSKSGAVAATGGFTP